MNLLGIHSLLEEVFECPLKEPYGLEDNILINPSMPFNPEGWQLCISKALVDKKVLKCLKAIVKKYNLELDSNVKEGYFVIDLK